MTSHSDLTDQVRALTDRAEIGECMMRYATGMDRRDRDVLRSASGCCPPCRPRTPILRTLARSW